MECISRVPALMKPHQPTSADVGGDDDYDEDGQTVAWKPKSIVVHRSTTDNQANVRLYSHLQLKIEDVSHDLSDALRQCCNS